MNKEQPCPYQVYNLGTGTKVVKQITKVQNRLHTAAVGAPGREDRSEADRCRG